VTTTWLKNGHAIVMNIKKIPLLYLMIC